MKTIFIYTIFMFLPLSGAFAGTADQPETGQKKCYNATGSEISCANTGQDGDKLAGVAWPAARFTDNANGTMTDNLTGLVWLKDAGCTFGGAPNNRTWANALSAVNALGNGQCGLADGSNAGDWRLPNVNELESLVHAGFSEETCSGPSSCSTNAHWLFSRGFSNLFINDYWSSTTYAGATTNAWVIGISSGNMTFQAKTEALYVLPVRSGP